MQLESVVPSAIATIYIAIDEFAKATLAAITKGKVRPATWDQLINALSVLGQFVTPEAASAAIAQLRDERDRERQK